MILDENNEAYNLLMTKVDLGFGAFAKYVFKLCKLYLIKTQEYSFFLLAGDALEHLDKCSILLSQRRKLPSKNSARSSHKK